MAEEVVRDDKGRIISGKLNPSGKAKGTLSSKTYWNRLQDEIGPDEFVEAYLIAFQSAKDMARKGNGTPKYLIEMVKDLADRFMGKPTQGLQISAATPEMWAAAIADEIMLPGEEHEALLIEVGESGDSVGEESPEEEGREANAKPGAGPNLQLVD